MEELTAEKAATAIAHLLLWALVLLALALLVFVGLRFGFIAMLLSMALECFAFAALILGAVRLKARRARTAEPRS